MKRLFTLLSLFVVVVCSFAQTFTYEGLTYVVLSSSDKTVEVSDGKSVSGDIVVPETVTYNDEEYRVTTIGYESFSGNKNLLSISLPFVTVVKGHAFDKCSSLTSVDSRSATTFGSAVFQLCTSLTYVDFSSVESIAYHAFYACSRIHSLRISSIEKWVNAYFENEYSYPTHMANNPVDIYIADSESPSTRIVVPRTVNNIADYAFYNTSIAEISFSSSTPTTNAPNSFAAYQSLIVPDALHDTYTTAWPSLKNQITKASLREKVADIVANDNYSALHMFIGEENLRHVLSLKIKGSINGQDIMVLHNKMVNLHYLDLSEATLVGNNYEYYTGGYHTVDDEITPYSFYNLKNLVSVNLPNVTAIRHNAFQGCSNLREINLPGSLTTLEHDAFSGCSSLPSIDIPGGVASIAGYAFSNCRSLKTLTLHEGLDNISSNAFNGCSITDIRFPESLKTIEARAFSGNRFEELNLPPNLNTIGGYAFENCSSLRVVRLNPMLRNISNYAFTGCNALKKVYTYTIEPTDILQDTYSAYKTADLYVPTPSYYTYYYNTQWSQFLSVKKSDEKYDFKSFYITKDFIMDDNTGIIGDKPDGDFGEGSGIVNNSSETQELGTVTIRFNGNNGSASIIANGNLTAEKIKVEITVTGNKWHFFCFPFDVPLSGVSTSGNKAYVFRHYNAELRATGASGWEDLPEDQTVLTAGEGYIFQANGNSTLTVEVDNKTTFVGENVAAALRVQDAANVANASWNFKGNPGYAYFDIDNLGFSAPITVWDPETSSYVALRPGDDDAFLHPFQAFFVQKPEGTDALIFNAEDRTTYLGSQKEMARKAARRRAASTADNPRKLINLTLTDGQTTDKTRVVFNDEKSMAYEIDCDAAKFAATGVPQLYSLDGSNTHYAINERPYGDGSVRLGFTADKAGHFSIEASRMDTPCYLHDLQLNITHDFNTGAYEFECQKGTFENRFVLVNAAKTDDATGIESIDLNKIGDDTVIYDLQGRQMQKAERGVLIVNGKKMNVK